MADERRRLHVVRDGAASSPHDRSRALDSLLTRAGRGDEQAFADLYDAAAGAVYGVALRVLRSPALAEEVAQDVLVEVWQHAARFDPATGSARAWIVTMAHRRAIDRVRSEQAHADRLRRHGHLFEASAPEPDDIVDVSYRAWRAERVRDGLSRLSDKQREALELAFTKGYTHTELARSLGVPLGTAKARVRDGLMKLRDLWEESP